MSPLFQSTTLLSIMARISAAAVPVACAGRDAGAVRAIHATKRTNTRKGRTGRGSFLISGCSHTKAVPSYDAEQHKPYMQSNTNLRAEGAVHTSLGRRP